MPRREPALCRREAQLFENIYNLGAGQDDNQKATNKVRQKASKSLLRRKFIFWDGWMKKTCQRALARVGVRAKIRRNGGEGNGDNI